MGNDWDAYDPPKKPRYKKPKPQKKSSGGGTGAQVGISALLFLVVPSLVVGLVVTALLHGHGVI